VASWRNTNEVKSRLIAGTNHQDMSTYIETFRNSQARPATDVPQRRCSYIIVHFVCNCREGRFIPAISNRTFEPFMYNIESRFQLGDEKPHTSHHCYRPSQRSNLRIIKPTGYKKQTTLEIFEIPWKPLDRAPHQVFHRDVATFSGTFQLWSGLKGPDVNRPTSFMYSSVATGLHSRSLGGSNRIQAHDAGSRRHVPRVRLGRSCT
jgi:hypothetical protein